MYCVFTRAAFIVTSSQFILSTDALRVISGLSKVLLFITIRIVFISRFQVGRRVPRVVQSLDFNVRALYTRRQLSVSLITKQQESKLNQEGTVIITQTSLLLRIRFRDTFLVLLGQDPLLNFISKLYYLVNTSKNGFEP